MNKNDFGDYIRVDVEEDISSASAVTFNFIDPKGNLTQKAGTIPGISVGDAVAGEYGEYLVEEGLLAFSGLWRIKLTVDYSGTRQRSTKYVGFPIGA